MIPVIFVALSYFIVDAGDLYLIFFVSLARDLLILLIFSNNQFLLSLIFSIDLLFSILVISAFLISGATIPPQHPPPHCPPTSSPPWAQERVELGHGGESGEVGGGEEDICFYPYIWRAADRRSG